MLVNHTLDSRARVFAEVKRASLRKVRASPLRTSMLRQTDRQREQEVWNGICCLLGPSLMTLSKA